MSRDVLVFSYGTLQQGFPHASALAPTLGRSLGRATTAEAWPLVVPHRAGCANAGCTLLHRMAVLLACPGEGLVVEGDLYQVDGDGLGELDRLEAYVTADGGLGPYRRRPIAVQLDGRSLEAQAYVAADAAPWWALVRAGGAAVVPRYPLAYADATPKPCCAARPGHPPPHDVIDPLALASA